VFIRVGAYFLRPEEISYVEMGQAQGKQTAWIRLRDGAVKVVNGDAALALEQALEDLLFPVPGEQGNGLVNEPEDGDPGF